MNFKLDKYHNNENTYVQVAGEIDAYTAPKLKEELLPLAEEPNPSLIISLKDVSYIDSTGLGVIIALYKQITKKEGKLKLVDLSERLERLFDITGLNNVITISSN
ncbi:anti-sigma factor antagonist [Bacillus sp. EB600]|uniref:anti-sigma factor antagonist n=1 Tax=Bacillus sp. EB600 TaxID=2806345 RepID=UPI00210A93C3|nr:anti-sigma factor antagonist [Bacillus sp. EB600]MCQ6282622.1 anti-sigma factor antagonist [Bacillus sp. EB600]